jgi:hypothetical protein
LTTINVATPSVTLIIDANAMNRVRRYRHESSSLYMPILGNKVGTTECHIQLLRLLKHQQMKIYL